MTSVAKNINKFDTFDIGDVYRRKRFAYIIVKPNTHRRRRRDETVELRRVGVVGVYMNSQLAHDACRRIR